MVIVEGGSGASEILVGIRISNPPTKTSYIAGENLALAGMTVQSIKTDGDTETYEDITGWTTDKADGSILYENTTSIVISWVFEGKTYITSQPVTVSPPKIYGVKWTYNNSSTALTRLTTANDSVVNTNIAAEATAGIGTTAGSSPFDNIYPWNEMDEYNVSGGAITVKRGETGFSRANDTVVKIPKFYYKVVDNSSTSTRCFYISQGPSDGFTLHPAFSRGGVEKDAIYVGRYHSTLAFSNTSTITGKAPPVSLTRV